MEVTILNVGQGSCAVLVSASGRVTVIDGGDETASPGRVSVEEWMCARHLDRIDHLVLTHLHRDHLQGLPPLARELTVDRAHLPYARFGAPEPSAEWLDGFERNAHVDSPHGQYHLVGEYLELLDALDGVDIVTAAEQPSTLWADGGFRLRQLFPLPGDVRRTTTLVAGLARLEDGALASALDAVSELANGDSAVFLLEPDDPLVPPIMFGGDQSGSESLWETIADRAEVRGAILILPHHGAPDGPSPALVGRMGPRMLVASVSAATAGAYRQHWDRLESAAGVPVVPSFEFPRASSASWSFGALRLTVGGL